MRDARPTRAAVESAYRQMRGAGFRDGTYDPSKLDGEAARFADELLREIAAGSLELGCFDGRSNTLPAALFLIEAIRCLALGDARSRQVAAILAWLASEVLHCISTRRKQAA
jgi:hypothetical protein